MLANVSLIYNALQEKEKQKRYAKTFSHSFLHIGLLFLPAACQQTEQQIQQLQQQVQQQLKQQKKPLKQSCCVLSELWQLKAIEGLLGLRFHIGVLLVVFFMSPSLFLSLPLPLSTFSHSVITPNFSA